jgi:hypothetical protein
MRLVRGRGGQRDERVADQAEKTNSKARDYDAALMPERLDRK